MLCCRQDTDKSPHLVLPWQRYLQLHAGAEEALAAVEAEKERAAARSAAGQAAHPAPPGADGDGAASAGQPGADGGKAWQRAPKSTQDGYFADFKLCISSPELLKLMVEFGHERPLLIDATFGTNDMKVWVSLWIFILQVC